MQDRFQPAARRGLDISDRDCSVSVHICLILVASQPDVVADGAEKTPACHPEPVVAALERPRRSCCNELPARPATKFPSLHRAAIVRSYVLVITTTAATPSDAGGTDIMPTSQAHLRARRSMPEPVRLRPVGSPSLCGRRGAMDPHMNMPATRDPRRQLERKTSSNGTTSSPARPWATSASRCPATRSAPCGSESTAA